VPGQVGRPACFDGAAESDLAPQLEAYCRRWCGSFHGTMMAARAADMRSAVEHAAQRSAANVLPSQSRSRIAYEARLRLPRARPREPAAVALTIDDCDRSESFAAIDEVQAGGLTRGPLANTTERRASGDLQVRSALAPRHPLPSRGGNPPCGDRRLRIVPLGKPASTVPGRSLRLIASGAKEERSTAVAPGRARCVAVGYVDAPPSSACQEGVGREVRAVLAGWGCCLAHDPPDVLGSEERGYG
jgi:hypothetical protein